MPNDTPELCIDPITGAEVLYAPQRARRTNALVREPLILPVTDFCPFCPGHEAQTPAEVYRWPTSTDVPWQLRIVPNRGYFVTQITMQDLNELYEYRTAVESACAELAASKDPDPQLMQTLHRLQGPYDTTDRASCMSFIEADTLFHVCIAADCTSA